MSSTLVDTPAPPTVRRRRGRVERLVPYAYMAPVLLLMVVLMLLPIVMVVWYSVQSNVISTPKSTFVGFDNYVEILGDRTFRKALVNTTIFTVASVVAHLVLGLAFAMMLNTELLGNVTKAIFRTIFVLPWLLTVAIIAIMWRLLLNPNGIINYLAVSAGIIHDPIAWLSDLQLALPAVTFINIWAGYPFFMVSLLAGLQGISRDMYEAALVDGANWFQRFAHVTIPQLRPIIISMALLDVIWTSQQFPLIWMTTGGGPLDKTEVLSTFTYKLAFSRYQFSMASASAVVILLISMALAYLYVRNQTARD